MKDNLISKLAVKVQKKLLYQEAFKENFNIEVVENGGVIPLLGDVPSRKYKKLAEDIARSYEGVSSVINEMDIDTALKMNPISLTLERISRSLPPKPGQPTANKLTLGEKTR